MMESKLGRARELFLEYVHIRYKTNTIFSYHIHYDVIFFANQAFYYYINDDDEDASHTKVLFINVF